MLINKQLEQPSLNVAQSSEIGATTERGIQLDTPYLKLDRALRRYTLILAALVCFSWCASPTTVSAEETATAETKAGVLTEESLGNLLGAMGLKPKKMQKRYDFDFTAIIDEEDWVLSMSAVLSQDGKSLWVMAWLDELPRSASNVPRTALLRLLARNDKMGSGKMFSYIASNRRFVLQRSLSNEEMSTKAFLAVLKDLGRTVVETHPEWSVENWNSKPVQTANEKASAPESKTTRTASEQPAGGTIRK